MGCGSSSSPSIPQPNTDDIIYPYPRLYLQYPRIYNDALISTDTKFQDFPNHTSNTFIGNGCKRMHNYQCILPYDKLDILREQFWLTRDHTDTNWNVLQKCCELKDDNKILSILKKHKLVLIEHYIGNTYAKKDPNYVYHIPNFCIIDPIFEKDFAKYEQLYDTTEDNQIECILWYYNEFKKYRIYMRNKNTGFDFKYKFLKLMNFTKSDINVRLFYKGQEILDTHCLYYHNVNNEGIIYVVTNPRVIETLSHNKLIRIQSQKEYQ